MRAGKVKFTKHAFEKFDFLAKYGFHVTETAVKETVTNPDKVERRDGQTLATKSMDDQIALRVVYRQTNDNIVVVTFYPVKRARYNV
jgi:hypothetical protein